MTFDYYTLVSIGRILGAMYIGCTLWDGGRFLRAMGVSFLAYAASVGIFLVRAYQPEEFQELLRLSGVTVQACALLYVAWLMKYRKFD